MSATSFSVEPAALQALAQRMKAVHHVIDASGRQMPADTEIGPACLVHALHSFTGNWSRARSDMLHHLELVAGGVALAAETYEAVDGGMAGQFGSTGG
jgi:Tfp pilus assembly protein PilO